MKPPIVSILVACYNHERYIEACINSILSQSYADIELLVIDDGSTDNSFEIIRALAEKHGFYAEQQANQGLAPTLNKMLLMAHGKYICQFGSDDIMMPDKTAKQVAFMEQHPDVAICGGNALLIDAGGQIITKCQKFPPRRYITFENLFANTAPGIISSSGMIRKDVLDREGGWCPEILLEDMYMWCKLTSRGYGMVGLNDVLMYYRKHEVNSYKNTRYMYESLTKTIAHYQEHSLYQQVYLDLLRGYFLTAAKYDKVLAREILRQIPVTAWNKKVLRGLCYLLLKTRKRR